MLNSITPRVLLQFFEELPSLPANRSITWIMLCCIPVIPVTLKSTTWGTCVVDTFIMQMLRG